MTEHLSDWHDFNAEDRKTYPEMNTSPIQVRFANGTTEEATGFDIIVQNKLKGAVTAWRYIKASGQ
jgi:hypothetical protein